MYDEQKGICPITKKWYDIADMDADHIIPRAKGGPTQVWNGRMICRKVHQGFALAYTNKNKKDASDDKSKSRKAA
jgi:5-methylcytosine-specific restriction endonuclease McrA